MRHDLSCIIVSHNYGHLLARCIQSVLGQVRTPDEILVVDAASTDSTESITRSFPNVSYLRVEARHPLAARRAGIEQTQGELVCCIDADDWVDPFYFQNAERLFAEDYRIAVVYSDVEYQGLMSGRSWYPEDSLESDISAANFIHSGSVFRRSAASLTNAFALRNNAVCHEDWQTWRQLLQSGFWAVKQPAYYNYYRHLDSLSRSRHLQEGSYSYYQSAALDDEIVTLAVFLSGEPAIWSRCRNFIDSLDWPGEQLRLFIVVPNAISRESVTNWMRHSRISDIEVYLLDESTQERGLAFSELERSYQSGLKAFETLAARLDTPYALLLQDYLLPSPAILQQLLNMMTPTTVAVSAAHRPFSVPEESNEVNSFDIGCLLVRSKAFQRAMQRVSFEDEITQSVLSNILQEELHALGQIARAPAAACESLSLRRGRDLQGRELTAENFDEAFYTGKYADVRSMIDEGEVESGFAHYSLFGFNEGRVARNKNLIFDESFYLSRYPDVQEAVEKGLLASGLEHYEKYGRKEGRIAHFL